MKMLLCITVVLVLASLAYTRVSCPTFFGAQNTSQLTYPTPEFKVDFNNSTNEITIVVNAVYDPYAALVLDFVPYVATRRSLSEFGACENRDSNTTRKWSWRRDDYSACFDDEDNTSYYPASGHRWTRTDRDCNVVEYTYKSTLTQLVDECGQTLMGWRENDGKKQFYGNVYVTYVRPDRKYDYECIIRVNDSDNCDVHTVYSEQQIAFFLTNEITTSSTASCSDNGRIEVTSNLNWKEDSVNLDVSTRSPNPTNRGLLCSLQASYTGTANLPLSYSRKECSCDAHCRTSTFCTSDSTNNTCSQDWTIQSNGTYNFGSLNNGVYNLTWDVNNCTGYTAGMEQCPNSPTATCQARITINESLKASYQYMQTIKPFGALLVRQPPNDRFDYTFNNDDLKVWVRISPLVNTRANVYRVDYCEADDDGQNCNNGWNTLKTWNEGEISPNQYVEVSTVIEDPRNKVFLFRVIGDRQLQGITTLILDTHRDTDDRIAPVPTTYVAVDRTYCDGNYDGDQDDGFLIEGIDLKKVIKLAGAILAALAVV